MIKFSKTESTLEIRLSRPEKANAITTEMFRQMTTEITNVKNKLIIFSAEGKNFCAGADLTEMRSAVDIDTYCQVIEEFFIALERSCNLIVVNCFGHICGAGVGICAIADIVIAKEDSLFSCPEVKSGIAPAIISPYVISKIGLGHAREWFITGRTHNIEEAMLCGLVQFRAGEYNYLKEIDIENSLRVKHMLNKNLHGAKGLKEFLK